MKKQIFIISFLFILIQISQQYKYHSHVRNRNRNRIRKHKKQIIRVGPFKNLNQGFDPNAEKRNPLLETPVYRSLGPVGVGFNKKYEVKKNDREPYYDQVQAPPKPLEQTDIQEMKQNNIDTVTVVKPRINEKQPEPYYDPTVHGLLPVDVHQTPNNVYVVGVNMKEDLRDEEPEHKVMKEQLRKQTHQQQMIDKAYYDPTAIDTQPLHNPLSMLQPSVPSQAQSVEDFYKQQDYHNSIKNKFLLNNNNNLHHLSDYHQNHRIDTINKARLLNHQMRNEVLPPVYANSPQNYYRKKKLRKLRL